MKIKSLLLIAFSAMFLLATLSSCGDKKSEPVKTPSEDVTPSDPGKPSEPGTPSEPDTPPVDPEPPVGPEPPSYAGTVRDACGYMYHYVKIGEQYWLAENMHCDKYSNNGDAALKQIYEATTYKFTPYFINASNSVNWNTKEYSNMSYSQISKLGYLYNWAAAVGLEDESSIKTSYPFYGRRQGICPDGWHIPSLDDYAALRDYVESVEGREPGTAGKYLKTTSGWYQEGNGEDSYLFGALPSNSGGGDGVYNTGTIFWGWIAESFFSDATYCYCINYNNDEFSNGLHKKDSAYAVRCVKN